MKKKNKSTSECEDACKSCGVVWHDHLGILGTCAKLENARSTLKVIRVWTSYTADSILELAQIQKLCDKTLEAIK